MTKLAGVVLLTVMLLVGGLGNYYYGQLARAYDQDRLALVAQARALLAAGRADVRSAAGELRGGLGCEPRGRRRRLPAPLRAAGAEPLRARPAGCGEPRGAPGGVVSAGDAGDDLRSLRMPGIPCPRWRTYPVGSGVPEYTGFGFSADGTTWEIGLLEAHRAQYLHGITSSWLAMLGIGGAAGAGLVPRVPAGHAGAPADGSACRHAARRRGRTGYHAAGSPCRRDRAADAILQHADPHAEGIPRGTGAPRGGTHARAVRLLRPGDAERRRGITGREAAPRAASGSRKRADARPCACTSRAKTGRTCTSSVKSLFPSPRSRSCNPLCSTRSAPRGWAARSCRG